MRNIQSKPAICLFQLTEWRIPKPWHREKNPGRSQSLKLSGTRTREETAAQRTLEIFRGFPPLSSAKYESIPACGTPIQARERVPKKLQENSTQHSHRARNNSCSHRPEWKTPSFMEYQVECSEEFCIIWGEKITPIPNTMVSPNKA